MPDRYIHQEYPKYKHHWVKTGVTVENADREAALKGGWADSPNAYAPYLDTKKVRPDRDDPLKWLEVWDVPGLLAAHRIKLKAALLRAHAAFWKMPDAPDAAVDAMKLAYSGIAQVLFEAGILGEQLLRDKIEQLVWDAAIAGGWWRFASETRQDIFPEEIGHYWVWRDERRDWTGLFRAERAEWQARLLDTEPIGGGASESVKNHRHAIEKEAERSKRQPGKQTRVTRFDPVRIEIREFKKSGYRYEEIRNRLSSKPRPRNAAWRDLNWPEAFRDPKFRNAVKTCIS